MIQSKILIAVAGNYPVLSLIQIMSVLNKKALILWQICAVT